MKKDGMGKSKKKTSAMCNDIAKRQKRRGISVDGVKLEEVENYKYLRKC